jgi:protein-L-isoaspartate(D-aspartate) O-methyltransferase
MNRTPRSRSELGPDDLVRALEVGGITDQRLLEAFRRVRRADFVPEAWLGDAYRDVPIPIGHAQVATQPSLTAHMIEALELRGREKVLEVGTGLGFQTAILASLSREVFSIEWFADLAAEARHRLRAAGFHNAKVITGDGSLGLPQYAPFDAILVSAAAPVVAPPLAQHLAEAGHLVQPIGPGGEDLVTLFRKRSGRLNPVSEVTGAYFVPLQGSYGARVR